jgi:hypothetical protein
VNIVAVREIEKCLKNLETATHLFIECPYVKKVWTLVAIWSDYNNLQPAS